jgi:Sulfotransferase domain
MQHWGLKHMSYSEETFQLWRNRKYRELLAWMKQYSSFEDWPWPLFYKEIDQAFPGTRFVLTRRRNAEIWFKSLCKHAEQTGPTDFRKYIYGYEMPHYHKEEHIKFYENHLQSVRNHFKGRPHDLLEVCWEEGDGWDELSLFLGLQRPGIPFPHANRSPRALDKIQRLTRRVARRL